MNTIATVTPAPPAPTPQAFNVEPADNGYIFRIPTIGVKELHTDGPDGTANDKVLARIKDYISTGVAPYGKGVSKPTRMINLTPPPPITAPVLAPAAPTPTPETPSVPAP